MNGKNMFLTVLMVGWLTGGTLMAQTTSTQSLQASKIDGVDYICSIRATSGVYSIMVNAEQGAVWTTTANTAAGQGYSWSSVSIEEVQNNGDAPTGADRCNNRQGSTCFSGASAPIHVIKVNGTMVGEKSSKSVNLELDLLKMTGRLSGFDLPSDHLGMRPLDRDDASAYRASQIPRWITYYSGVECWKNGATPKANPNFREYRDGMGALFAVASPTTSVDPSSNNGGRQNNMANADTTGAGLNTATVNPTSNNGYYAGRETIISKGARGQSDGGGDEKSIWRNSSGSYDERKSGLGGSNGQCNCKEGGCPVCAEKDSKERLRDAKSGGSMKVDK